jgi:hypothetical protein
VTRWQIEVHGRKFKVERRRLREVYVEEAGFEKRGMWWSGVWDRALRRLMIFTRAGDFGCEEQLDAPKLRDAVEAVMQSHTGKKK